MCLYYISIKQKNKKNVEVLSVKRKSIIFHQEDRFTVGSMDFIHFKTQNVVFREPLQHHHPVTTPNTLMKNIDCLSRPSKITYIPTFSDLPLSWDNKDSKHGLCDALV